MNLISVNNLFFKYNKINVLENINLDIKNSDFLAIIGPNGGGKSTLLKLLLGLIKPQKGNIQKSIKTDYIGYVPQNTDLNTDFPITALEVVLMGHIKKQKSLFGYSKDDKACAMNSLEKVGMKEFANTKIGDLSGGQRQRVFIARSLCASPKIILLDEPTANIDVKGQREIYELLKELNKSICIVVVSHDISVLLNYAKNVAHINKNLVYHNIENLNSKIDNENEHMCEVELLSALGNAHANCTHPEHHHHNH